MALDNYIKDPYDGTHATLVQQEGQNCLNVVTQEYKRYLNKSVYFSNPSYGINMNQDFSQVASTENVHNGNDNTYWTGTVTVGQPNRIDFQNGDYSYTGDYSIKCGDAKDGNEFQLANDTLILSSKYNRFAGWVYITQDWGEDSVYIYLFDTTAGEQVSENQIDLSNYINVGNNNVWQKFNIPMSDFGLIQDYDAIRFLISAEGNPPDFYLDDLVLEELSDEPAIFTIEPSKGRWWHVKGLGIVIASSYDSTLADASMPKIPYNGFLGISLTNGVNYQRQEEGEVIFSIVVKDMIDIINQYNSRITDNGYDGNYTWVKIDTTFDTPFILKPEFGDYVSMNFSDDLSGLQLMRIVAAVAEEKRTSSGLYDRNGLLRVKEAR